MIDARLILVSTMTMILLAAAACNSPSENGDTEDTEDTDTEDEDVQEENMCSALDATTGSLVMAGESFGEGGAINPSSGLKNINLVEVDGSMEGYVELRADDGTPLLMIVKEDVPMEILDADGEPATDVDYSETSEVCPAANGRLAWTVTNGYNHLHIGPTSTSEVHIALESID